MAPAPSSAKQANLAGAASSARLASWRDVDGGRAFYGEQRRLSAYVVRQIFAGAMRTISSTMNAQHVHHQAGFREPAQQIAAVGSDRALRADRRGGSGSNGRATGGARIAARTLPRALASPCPHVSQW